MAKYLLIFFCLLPALAQNGARRVPAGPSNLVTKDANGNVVIGTTVLVQDVAGLRAQLATATDITVAAGTYALAGTGITIPATVKRFWMLPGAFLTYTGTGTAVTLATLDRAEVRVNVRRTVADWDVATGTGTDVATIGILADNCTDSDLHVTATNFWTGFRLATSASDSTHNRIYIGALMDNKIGFQFLPSGGHGTNQNTIIGGRVRLNSGHTVAAAGTRYILLSAGSNNANVFIGVAVENEMPERSLDVFGSYNAFHGMRFEANPDHAIVFDAAATGNALYNCYFSSSYAAQITDNGTGNMILGPSGFKNVPMLTGNVLIRDGDALRTNVPATGTLFMDFNTINFRNSDGYSNVFRLVGPEIIAPALPTTCVGKTAKSLYVDTGVVKQCP
jgi:hypothetical protein